MDRIRLIPYRAQSEWEIPMVDREYFTLVFEGDLTKFQGNPLKIETPFGVAFAAGLGNAFDKLENIEEIAEAAQKLLDTIDRRPVSSQQSISHHTIKEG